MKSRKNIKSANRKSPNNIKKILNRSIRRSKNSKRHLTEFPPIKRDIKARIARGNSSARGDQGTETAHRRSKRTARRSRSASQRVFEENRKQDVKRVADLQGELTALRKRIDEARVKADLTADSFKNIDNRIKEFMLSEAERKAAQTAFIEKQSIAHIDREHSYKEWQEKLR